MALQATEELHAALNLRDAIRILREQDPTCTLQEVTTILTAELQNMAALLAMPNVLARVPRAFSIVTGDGPAINRPLLTDAADIRAVVDQVLSTVASARAMDDQEDRDFTAAALTTAIATRLGLPSRRQA